jgi:hypothetical protein
MSQAYPAPPQGTQVFSAVGGTGLPLLTATTVLVYAVATNLLGLDLFNAAAATTFLQFFDAKVLTGGGSPTLGTTVPKLVIAIPAGAAFTRDYGEARQVMFLTGLVVAATTTATGSTAPATGLQANIVYRF